MGLATTWMPFLIIFILAKIGFSGSLVFYDSMLGDVTTPERMDVVSSQGYAWGYIGSCVPFVVCLALVLGSGAIGLSQMTQAEHEDGLFKASGIGQRAQNRPQHCRDHRDHRACIAPVGQIVHRTQSPGLGQRIKENGHQRCDHQHKGRVAHIVQNP